MDCRPHAAAILVSLALLLGAAPVAAAQPVAEMLRGQGAPGQAGCGGIERALAGGVDRALVVRTAVELGYKPCQVIRCALAGQCPRDDSTNLEQAVRGAAAAGVPPDVVARCALEVCDPAAVAAVMADVLFEPNYCYFAPRPPGAPLPPPLPVIDRSAPAPQVSPFRF